jgi:hypothetical protein
MVVAIDRLCPSMENSKRGKSNTIYTPFASTDSLGRPLPRMGSRIDYLDQAPPIDSTDEESGKWSI